MIEAALDRTLIAPNVRQADVTKRVEEELTSIGLPMEFEEFVETTAQKFDVQTAEIEEAFWGLIDSGKLSLTHDFKVKLR